MVTEKMDLFDEWEFYAFAGASSVRAFFNSMSFSIKIFVTSQQLVCQFYNYIFFIGLKRVKTKNSRVSDYVCFIV